MRHRRIIESSPASLAAADAKIEPDPSNPQRIEAVSGLGWRFNA